MNKSIKQLRDEMKLKYKTADNTYANFPIGTQVKIITPCQDFHFFYGETGEVTKNKYEYLSITVKFDIPRRYEDGTTQREFSFEPSDLLKIPDSQKAERCQLCGHIDRGKD